MINRNILAAMLAVSPLGANPSKVIAALQAKSADLRGCVEIICGEFIADEEDALPWGLTSDRERRAEFPLHLFHREAIRRARDFAVSSRPAA